MSKNTRTITKLQQGTNTLLTLCYGSDNRELFAIINRFFTKCEKSQGRKEAIRVSKVLFTHAVDYAIGEHKPYTDSFWIKGMGKTLPNILIPFRPLLDGNAEQKRIALTVLKHYEEYYLSPDYTVTSITEKSVSEPVWLKDFEDFAENYFSEKKSLPYPKALFITTSMGPNGPAVAAAHHDAATLMGNNEVFDNIKALASLINEQFASRLVDNIHMLSSLPSAKPGILSKLAFLSEKGGKTRVIAMADYFTQLVLQPIHDLVMDELRSIPEDGTFNQNKVAIELGSIVPEFLYYSFDSTNFTDRFPVFLQEIVLKCLTGSHEVAKFWRKLLTERDFLVPKTKETVRYAQGQPMGFLSSWAVAALSHHILVRFACCNKNYNRYRIIGDDVVICDESVAIRYRDYMTELGVKISKQKSIISPHSYEFAKRLFHKGEEISPLQTKLVKAAITEWTFVPQLFQNLYSRSFLKRDLSTDSRGQTASFNLLSVVGPFIKAYHKKKEKELFILCTCPIHMNGDENPLGFSPLSPWGAHPLNEIEGLARKVFIHCVGKNHEGSQNKSELARVMRYSDIGVMGLLPKRLVRYLRGDSPTLDTDTHKAWSLHPVVQINGQWDNDSGMALITLMGIDSSTPLRQLSKLLVARNVACFAPTYTVRRKGMAVKVFEIFACLKDPSKAKEYETKSRAQEFTWSGMF